MRCKYCNTEVEQNNFCSNCGRKLEQPLSEETSKSNDENHKQYETVNNSSSTNTQSVPLSKINIQRIWKFVAAGIVIYFLISLFSCGRVKDEDYISSAQTVISKNLAAPATAEFSNGKVVDKDKYGRALVTITVDAQNGFGAYLRHNYAVVIFSYNKKTDEFSFDESCIVDLDNDELSDLTVEYLKTRSNWNEPLESD